MNRLWQRSLILLLVMLVLIGPTIPAGYAQGWAVEADGYLPDEVTVKLLQASDLPGVAADHGLDPTPLDQFGAWAIYRLSILDGTLPPDKAAELEADPRVVYAEPNFLGHTPEGQQRSSWAKGGDSETYHGQRALTTARFPEAHTITRGAGVIVAVLDTGVDATHPDLAGHLIAGYDFVDLDDDPNDEGDETNLAYGHGTHVTGLIALAAPDADIMPVRVLDPEGLGNIWVLSKALAYAVDPDGNPETNDGARVINLSLGTTQVTNLLPEIVAAVTCANGDDDDDDDDCLGYGPGGAVVVSAAGNSGTRTREYPAAERVRGSLAVAASTITDTLATFSNFGPWVRVAAPGEAISSTIPLGEYAVWSGTSMATPLAAGEAVLVRAAFPNLNAISVVRRIVANAATIAGAVPRRIDAAAAVGFGP